ncbi:YdhK family protein [Paenibacillus alginolyticus]|uniref:YdhK family protein n=1 Tax=Paenibacillus alginolyticus TaxID=59839 RepID=UPI0003F5D012|nr:YdhK family protein [Paenibacillus alginolyticus]MCY9666409.1 YdhK family protein [Paenibacillus alginolyticus]
MKKQLIFLSIATIIALGGCGNNTSQQPVANMNHSDMKRSSSSEVPKGLKEAKNPTYPIGSQAIIQADHMPGMKGAKATIVGAYDTTAYAVSYTPTTGGQPVKNHKWVVREEIKNAGNETLKPGTVVTLETDHMRGMKGATAKIDSAETTTVYMVDYTPTTGGETIKNHKWVTENELSTN